MITRTGDSLQVSGNVIISTVSALFKEGLKPQANSKIEVDFAKIEKMDSSAVSLMLAWLREAQRNQATLHFINVPENLLSLAKMYGVTELLTLNTAE